MDTELLGGWLVRGRTLFIVDPLKVDSRGASAVHITKRITPKRPI